METDPIFPFNPYCKITISDVVLVVPSFKTAFVRDLMVIPDIGSVSVILVGIICPILQSIDLMLSK